MPVTAAGMGSLLLSTGSDLTGRKWVELALIVSRSVSTWSRSRSNLLLTGVTTGVAGAGKVTGKLVVPPNPALLMTIFSSAGLNGPHARAIARVVGVAVPSEFSSKGMYSGESTGVGVGADSSKVILANGPVLSSMLVANMSSQGWSGQQANLLATALGTGIAALLLAGTGVGGVTGGGGPSPAVGTSLSGVL